MQDGGICLKIKINPTIILTALAALVTAILLVLSAFMLTIKFSSSHTLFGNQIIICDEAVFGTPTLIAVNPESRSIEAGQLFLLKNEELCEPKVIVSAEELSLKYDCVNPENRTDLSEMLLLRDSPEYVGDIVYQSAFLGGAVIFLSQNLSMVIILAVGLVLIFSLSAAALVLMKMRKAAYAAHTTSYAARAAYEDGMAVEADEDELLPAIRHISFTTEVDDPEPSIEEIEETIEQAIIIEEEIFHQTFHEPIVVMAVEDEKPPDSVPSIDSLIDEINSFLPSQEDEWDNDLKIYRKK